LWGAPRIHGELLKLGIKISQATVGRWMPWRPKVPSSTWRSLMRNHLPDIAAIDMFVVATATFQLLYTLIVLSLDRRRIVHFEVTANPTQDWLSGQMTEAFPWDTAPRYLLLDRDKSYGPAFRHRVRASLRCNTITFCRSAAFSAASCLFDLKGKPSKFSTNRRNAIIAADVRRFCDQINRPERACGLAWRRSRRHGCPLGEIP
jgi:hypothetical protein